MLASGLGADRAEVRAVRRQADRRFLGRARIRRGAEAAGRHRRRRDRPGTGQRLAAARRRGRRSSRRCRDFLPMADRSSREEALRALQEAGPGHPPRRQGQRRDSRWQATVTRATSPMPRASRSIDSRQAGRRGRSRPYTEDLLGEGTGVELDERGFIEVDRPVPHRRRTSGRSATACAARCWRTRARRKA